MFTELIIRRREVEIITLCPNEKCLFLWVHYLRIFEPVDESFKGLSCFSMASPFAQRFTTFTRVERAMHQCDFITGLLDQPLGLLQPIGGASDLAVRIEDVEI